MLHNPLHHTQLTIKQDQPLLKVPNELGRKNFKTTQRLVERERDYILGALKTTAHASLTGTSPLESLDDMINRMNTLKRRLEVLQEEEKTINAHSHKRMRHLQDLYEIPSLADVKYDEWSRIRLNRLLVDFLLRNGHLESARQLAKEKEIEELVDVDAFVQCHKIEGKLRQGDLIPCLNWCADNKASLKKVNVGYGRTISTAIEANDSKEQSRNRVTVTAIH